MRARGFHRNEQPSFGPNTAETLVTLSFSSVTSLTAVDVMKAWSLVGFLIGRDRTVFPAFLSDATGIGSAEALEKHYGLDPDELDAAWRAFVIDNG